MKAFAWAKVVAVGLTVLVLGMVLARIGFLVDERQAHQWQAVQSVQQSHAGAQTLLGPVLQRQCTEEWPLTVGEGKSQRVETQRREFTLQAVPDHVTIDSDSQADARYRGMFKVNSYIARLQFQARWSGLAALQAKPEQPGGKLSCRPTTVWLAVGDVRGLRSAQLSVADAGSEAPLVVRPGTGTSAYSQGLHAELPLLGLDGSVPGGPLTLQAALQLVGTSQLALVPAADSTKWTLRSDWPHPSFGGRFLPTQREVGQKGFTAQWAVTALATSAPRDVVQGAVLCAPTPASLRGGADDAAYTPAAEGKKPCLDTFSVAFIDPVNPYTLSDRAIKYGLLFVLLTFTAMALAEALGRDRVRRVHPVQYALVGLALCMFFLLLLSLSEHLPFWMSYTVASGAVVPLLGIYGRHMLGRARDGAAFAFGMALLYALLYLLLQREQTALLIGSLGLFMALAAVMLLTRKVDWYRLTQSAAAGATPAKP